MNERNTADQTAFLENALNFSFAGIYVYHIALGRNLYINEQYTRITGYRLDEINEMSGEQFFSLFHPDDQENVSRHMENLTSSVSDESQFEIEYRFRCKSGDWAWCLSRDRAFERDEQGQVVSFIGTFLDITERKALEEKLIMHNLNLDNEIHRKTVQLEEKKVSTVAAQHRAVAAEHRIRQLFEHMKDGVAVYKAIDDGTDFVFVDFNLAAEQSTGYNRSDVLGRKVTELFPYIKEMGLFEVFQQVYQSGESKHYPARQYADERLISWFENDVYRLPSREVVAIFRDVTNAKQSELDLYKALDDAEKANLAKDEFLATMSHELRTPLTTIIGNSQHLIENGCGREDCRLRDSDEMLAAIEHAGRSQLALVNDIIDLSKIESGKFVVNEQPYDLSSLLKEIDQLFSHQARKKGLQWLVEQKNREQQPLRGDAQRVSQVLANLISNAIKFTPEGHVELISEVADQHLRFTIKDSGIGMSAEVMKKLFTRFGQADSTISRRFGGSGLGLYISQSLAELMDGSIEVTSQEGAGSSFILTLPYHPCDKQATDEPQEQEAATTPEPQHLSGQVLLADDMPAIQLLIQRMLESMEVEVTIANNGAEAVSLAGRHHFDLILMDMQMPEMDGIQATRTLRESGNRTPIVALTANVMKKHRKQFEDAGCNHFLSKPIEKQELREVLQRYLGATGTGSSQG